MLSVQRYTLVLVAAVLAALLSCCARRPADVRSSAHFAAADSLVESLTTTEALHALADSLAAADDAVGEMLAQQRLGKLLRNASEFTGAIEAHNRCLELASELADTIEMVRALNNLGTNFRRMGNMEEATSFHYQALALCEQCADKRSQLARKNRVTALNGIGNICMTLGNYTTADSVLRAALEGEQQLHSDLGQAINWANLGAICQQRGQTDSAWVYYRRSMILNQRAGSEVGIGLCRTHFGQMHEQAGRTDSALAEYRQAYDLLQRSGDTWHWLEAALALARVNIERGDLPQASRYLVGADSAATAIGSLEHRAEVYRLKYLMARHQGDVKRALDCYIACDSLRDSLTSSQSVGHLQNTRVDYVRKRSQNEIALIDAHYHSERQLRQLLIAVVTLLLVLAGVGYWLYRSRTRAQRLANQLLADQLLALGEKQRHDVQAAARAESREIEQERADAQAESDREFVERFTQAVYDAMDCHQVDMERIASQLCVTGSQLRRRIRAITGQSPLGYANTVRMAKARHLLAHSPELTVGDIAEQCGFYDVAHFSRLFKQTYQLTPTQFRGVRG